MLHPLLSIGSMPEDTIIADQTCQAGCFRIHDTFKCTGAHACAEEDCGRAERHHHELHTRQSIQPIYCLIPLCLHVSWSATQVLDW